MFEDTSKGGRSSSYLHFTAYCFFSKGLEYRRGGEENTKRFWSDIYYYRLLYYANGDPLFIVNSGVLLSYKWGYFDCTSWMFHHALLWNLAMQSSSSCFIPIICVTESAPHTERLLWGMIKSTTGTLLTICVDIKSEISVHINEFGVNKQQEIESSL